MKSLIGLVKEVKELTFFILETVLSKSLHVFENPFELQTHNQTLSNQSRALILSRNNNTVQ